MTRINFTVTLALSVLNIHICLVCIPVQHRNNHVKTREYRVLWKGQNKHLGQDMVCWRMMRGSFHYLSFPFIERGQGLVGTMGIMCSVRTGFDIGGMKAFLQQLL